MSPKESRSSKIIEYHDGKFWFHKKLNVLIIGLTQEGLESIGEAQSVQLPEKGDDFSKEDVICEIDGTDGGLQIPAPAGGFISEINDSLTADVSILNEDPIDEGWLVKIEMEDESDLKEFL